MTIDVTAAILRRNGLILLARRGAGRHLAGKWEFPGGKIEPGETAESCLRRELKEEFEIEAEVGAFVDENLFEYPEAHRVIRLCAYEVKYLSGAFHLRDHDQIKWVEAHRLTDYDLAPADIPIALKLAAIK